MPNRMTGQQVSVYSLGGTDYIDDLENFTFDFELKTKEAKGISDAWDYPWGVGQNMKGTADVYVGSSAHHMALAGQSLMLSLVTGGVTYSGRFLLNSTKHTMKKDDLQMQAVTLMSQGTITIS